VLLSVLKEALKETHSLDDNTILSVCTRMSTAQQLTRQRVVPFLDEVLAELSSFEVEEAH